MDLSEDPCGGGDSSAGSQAQQPPRSLHDGAGSLSANNTNPVQVMPCQIQMFAKFDDQGRRYMVLENLPLDKNYVANWINNGAEFAIGGTPEFISNALTNELAARVVQDSRNQYTQSWHVVVFPDSNMSHAPMSHMYRGSEATERYSIATALRPTFQNYQNNPQITQKAMFLQHSQNDQLATFVQQPMLTHSSAMGGYGRGDQSVSRSQQSQFTTPISGAFSNGGGSTLMFPQEQFYSQTPQQGSFQGFGPSNGLAQGNYQGQSNNMMFNQNNGLEPLPQVHRPIFDKHGYIVEEGNRNDGNMYGDNLYNDNMYKTRMGNTFGSSQPIPFQGPQQQFNPPQQVQDAEMRRAPQLAAAAQSFYSFVTNKMDLDGNYQDKGDQVDDYQDGSGSEENENQDEGIAMGNTRGRDANSSTSQQAPPPNQPESPPAEVLLASEKEPWRFTDRTGTGLCDYCGRDGHEAEACLKWDPIHYDKPVCTACNNDQHSLDECPRFLSMPMSEKQALLLDKGAGRPGVRSQYHPWTSYVHRNSYENGGGARLPLTRRFLFNLSVNPESGETLQNVWKVWDYNRGVPDQFRDPRAESLAGDPAAPVDERFMDGKHGLG